MLKPAKSDHKNVFAKSGISLSKGGSFKRFDTFVPLPQINQNIVCGIDYSKKLGALEIQVGIIIL